MEPTRSINGCDRRDINYLGHASLEVYGFFVIVNAIKDSNSMCLAAHHREPENAIQRVPIGGTFLARINAINVYTVAVHRRLNGHRCITHGGSSLRHISRGIRRGVCRVLNRSAGGLAVSWVRILSVVASRLPHYGWHLAQGLLGRWRLADHVRDDGLAWLIVLHKEQNMPAHFISDEAHAVVAWIEINTFAGDIQGAGLDDFVVITLPACWSKGYKLQSNIGRNYGVLRPVRTFLNPQQDYYSGNTSSNIFEHSLALHL